MKQFEMIPEANPFESAHAFRFPTLDPIQPQPTAHPTAASLAQLLRGLKQFIQD